jgi:hypothetical protein
MACLSERGSPVVVELLLASALYAPRQFVMSGH